MTKDDTASTPKTAKTELETLQDEFKDTIKASHKAYTVVSDLTLAGLADKGLLEQCIDFIWISEQLDKAMSARRLTKLTKAHIEYCIEKIKCDYEWCLQMALNNIDTQTIVDTGYSVVMSVIADPNNGYYKTFYTLHGDHVADNRRECITGSYDKDYIDGMKLASLDSYRNFEIKTQQLMAV